MAGRYHMSRHSEDSRDSHIDPRIQGRPPLPICAADLEDELREKHEEVKRIFTENRMIIDDNTLLKRELVAVKDEIQRLGLLIPALRAQKGAGERDLIEREVKLKADLRATDTFKTETAQLRTEVQDLNSVRQVLFMQIQGLTNVVERFKVENQMLVLMRTDIELLKQKLVDARNDYEYEKKANEEQVEQKQSIEKNILFMVNEIEKLKEQLNDQRRLQGQGTVSYDSFGTNPDMRHVGAWDYYEKYGPRH